MLMLRCHRGMWLALGFWCLFAGGVRADDDPFGGLTFDRIGGQEPEPVVTATLVSEGDAGTVTLQVRFELPPGGNIYSQDKSFARPTSFDIAEESGLSPLDADFSPDHAPKRAFDPLFKKEVEKFTGEVTFSRRYELQPGIDPAQVTIQGKVDYLFCLGTCTPHSYDFIATLASAGSETAVPPERVRGLFEEETGSGVEELGPPGTEDSAVAPSAAGNSRAATKQLDAYRTYPYPPRKAAIPAVVEFQLDRSAGNGRVIVAVTIALAEGYHTRAIDVFEGMFDEPTVLTLDEVRGLKPVSQGFQANVLAEPVNNDLGGEVLKTREHEGRVTWTQVFEVDGNAEPGVAGSLTFMVCEGIACLRPVQVPIRLGSLYDSAVVAGAEPIDAALPAETRAFALGESGSSTPATSADIAYHSVEATYSLGRWLLYAFLGGLILNVMPCVLPVISIKVLSFVHQAGEHPGRIFLLNAVYGLGVLTVFNIFAGLALTLQFGWGGAVNSSVAYQITMAAIVFAMGLSLLGVFEIPIPGMMSSGLGGKQHGEGLVGAFLTGILATLLATPCTGPFMGATLLYSLKYPAPITLLIWNVMGLGMASPYLAIGCFPKLVDWLPRPGQWMVTFKQFCGFVLMATTVWLLNSVQALNTQLIVPTLIILVGVSLMVWMVGQLYDLSSTPLRRWTVRGLSLLTGGAVIVVGGAWSYRITHPPEATADAQAQVESVELDWEPFSTAKLDELIQAREPVLIDFTAEWCAICKFNEYWALNTRPTHEFVEAEGIRTLKADYTAYPPEIKQWLNKFGQDGVPLYVFIPAGQPGKTQRLSGALSQDGVLEALRQTIADAAPATTQPTRTANSQTAVSLNQ
jgi:suppressor for copper-sensitivity B